jgi:hypothetical protein
MILHVMYEMEFIPSIDVEKVEAYTGQVTPTESRFFILDVNGGNTQNLLRHAPGAEQVVFRPQLNILDEHFPVKYSIY